MIITIDGFSGTGKTSIAKNIAKKISWTYFDTGAMYRAVTLFLIEKQIFFSDIKKIEIALQEFTYDIRQQDGEEHYYIGEMDVTLELRTQKVNDHVSEVSAIPYVRNVLWEMQHALAKKQNAVFEGRDMGSVVFPDAELKIFLDAKPEVRAARRLKEMRQKFPKEVKDFDEKTILKQLERRDKLDSTRELAPLICPKGAHRIDTSDLTIDQVVEKILKIHKKSLKKLLYHWFRKKKAKKFYVCIIFLTRLIFKAFYRHHVYGLEHFTKSAAIFAPNHTSYLDPPIIAISWPGEIHFLARESLFKPFLFGSVIRALNSHPVSGDVSDVSVFKTIIEILKSKKQIVLFPEGKRSSEDALGKIKPGIGMFVMRSNAVIIPTYIHGAYEVWNRMRKLPKFFGKTACVFGSSIKWEPFSHLSKKEAHLAIAEKLTESMEALRKWYKDGAEGIPP